MESNQQNNPLSSQNKDKYFKTQLETIFNYLQDHIATASMVARHTGIAQKCITRYKRDLENSGRLWEVKKMRCEITGFKAWYLTTNPNFAPSYSRQYKLF